jgi:ABC-2 type transport system permease protein
VIAKTQLAASQLALVATFLPAFLLSGFLFSIDQMPAPIRAVTRIIPARYYVTALKKIFLKGMPLETLEYEMIPLAIFAIALAAVATRVFRKKLS